MRIDVRIAGMGGQLGRVELTRLRERILAKRLRRPAAAGLPENGQPSNGGPGVNRRMRKTSRRPVE